MTISTLTLTLINLYMNEGEGRLKDRRKPTEQVSWHLVHTIFLELFTVDLLKKINLSVQRYLQNKLSKI